MGNFGGRKDYPCEKPYARSCRLSSANRCMAGPPEFGEGSCASREEGNPARGVATRAEPNKFLTRLLLAAVEGEFLRSNHLSMHPAAVDGFSLDSTLLRLCYCT